jgi:PAS domain S-box-containing protein
MDAGGKAPPIDRSAARLHELDGVRALLDAANRGTALLEELPGYLVVCDREARIQFINKTAPGFDRASVVGTPAADHLLPRDRESFLEALDAVFRTGVPRDLEVSDLYGRPYTTRLLPLEGEGGVRSVLAVASDLTEHRNAGQALRETEERYQLLFESVPVPLLTFDPASLAVREANRAALELFGYSRREFTRKSVTDIAIGEEVPALRQALLRSDGGLRKIGVWRNRRKDGTTFHAEISTHSCTVHGETLGVALLDDVSERMRADREREQLEEQLRQVQKMEAIGLLAGGVAHDFNNLLMPILGYAERAAHDPGSNERVRDYMDRIQAAAAQARNLVRQLLAFGREQTLRTRVLDLAWEVSQFESMMRRLIPETIVLDVQSERGLPPVEADPSQVQQILMNLVLNAQGAMPAGGRLGVEVSSIELDAAEARGLGLAAGVHVQLSVSDTGHGIDPSVLPHIFEPFFTTRQRDRGTGLGLATVYGIVKQHRGAIRVDSAPGRGARFDVLLPAVEEALPVTQVAPRPAGPAGAGETILLVEDDDVVRKLLCDALAAEGYAVLAASRADEALELAARSGGAIRVLVTDVVLPGMNGRELRRSLERSIPGVRTLYISGYSGDALGGAAGSADDAPLLEKPFPVHKLAARVRQLLDA